MKVLNSMQFEFCEGLTILQLEFYKGILLECSWSFMKVFTSMQSEFCEALVFLLAFSLSFGKDFNSQV